MKVLDDFVRKRYSLGYCTDTDMCARTRSALSLRLLMTACLCMPCHSANVPRGWWHVVRRDARAGGHPRVQVCGRRRVEAQHPPPDGRRRRGDDEQRAGHPGAAEAECTDERGVAAARGRGLEGADAAARAKERVLHHLVGGGR